MAELVFETSSELYKAIEKDIREASQEVNKEFEKMLKESVNETVYARGGSGTYQRTQSMRDSTNSMVGNAPRAEGIDNTIYFDESKMKYNYPSQSGGSSDNRGNIVKWLNDGHRGYYNGRPVNYPAQKFLEKTLEKIKKSATKLYREALDKKGIDTI